MCTFLSLSLTLTVFLHKFMLFIPKLKSFTMTLKIIFVSFWKFGLFSSVPRKRAGIQRKPSDKLKIGDPFQWYQWSIKSACSNGIACYRRIKKNLWLSFSFFHCPSETLLSVTLSTAFRWSLSGESLEKDDYLLGGTKGNTFLLSDLALTFLAKILITLNCWFCLCPLLPQPLINSNSCPNFFMWGLSAATHTVFTVSHDAEQ